MALPAKRVQLYCQRLDATVDGHTLVPSSNFAQDVTSIRAAFPGLPQAVVCDVKGDPIRDFAKVKDGDRLLVFKDEYDHVQPEAYHYVLYLPKVGDNVDKNWLKATRAERAAYLVAIQNNDPIKNVVRITMPHTYVQGELARINYSLDSRLKSNYSPDVTFKAMQESWYNMKFDAMFDHPFNAAEKIKPPGDPKSWDLRLLPTLVLLSDCTAGQPLLARSLVLAAIKKRTEKEPDNAEAKHMLTEDIINVLDDMYKQADAIDSDWLYTPE